MIAESFLTSSERERLQQILESDVPVEVRNRALILLLTDQGLSSAAIAQKVGLTPSGVRYWRGRYRAEGEASFFGKVAEQSTSPAAVKISLPEQPERSQAGVPGNAPEPVAVPDVDQEQRQEFVHDMALELFDTTHPLHGLDKGDRNILEQAIYFSQVREFKSVRKDPEALRQWLEEETQSRPSDSGDLDKLSALLTFRKGKVKNTELERLNLSLEQQKETLALVALLRMALGLDESRSQQTHIQGVEPIPSGLRLVVDGPEAESDASAAQQALPIWDRAGFPKLEVLNPAEAEQARKNDLLFPIPSEQPGIQPSDPMSEAGRKAFRFQFSRMLSHEAGTRLGEDPEELHDMRVATRRMRAAFEIFQDAYQPKACKPLLKGMRATGRALGRVRDLDVLIDKATRYAQSLPEEERSSLNPLIEGWQQDRSLARQEMAAYLDSPAYQEFKINFNLFVTTPGAGALPAPTDHVVADRVQERVPVLVYTRLAAVRAYDSLLSNASLEQLHALRIEFKKFRYTVEFFQEVLGGESQGIIDFLKKVQDHLGDLNDADVATRLLRTFLDDWDSRQAEIPIVDRQNPQGVVAYLSFQLAERHRLMMTFQQVWEKFLHPEFRQQLAKAVSVL